MNLSVEVIGTIASVVAVVLLSVYKLMQSVTIDTETRIEASESKAHKKLEEIQAVANYLQGQLVEIQADGNKLLKQMLEMEKRETAREKELGEAKTQTLQAQAGEIHAKHLQADAEKERDSAIEAKKQALELVDVQDKALQQANATVVELRKQLNEAHLEIAIWKNKYEGAIEMGGKVRVEVVLPSPVITEPVMESVLDVVAESATEAIPEIEKPKEG